MCCSPVLCFDCVLCKVITSSKNCNCTTPADIHELSLDVLPVSRGLLAIVPFAMLNVLFMGFNSAGSFPTLVILLLYHSAAFNAMTLWLSHNNHGPVAIAAVQLSTVAGISRTIRARHTFHITAQLKQVNLLRCHYSPPFTPIKDRPNAVDEHTLLPPPDALSILTIAPRPPPPRNPTFGHPNRQFPTQSRESEPQKPKIPTTGSSTPLRPFD